MANIEGATDVLIAALRSMTASERERTWERVSEIISLPTRVETSFLGELPILVQATIWEGAWRVAPWTTHDAVRRRSFHSSPFLNPRIVNDALLFRDSERFPEARALIQSAAEIEGGPDWLDETRVMEALGRLERAGRTSVERSVPPPTRELEYLSRVLLIGNPFLSFKIIEYASRFRRDGSPGVETVDSYFHDDFRQFICFALMRIPRTSDARKLARQVRFLYNRVSRESMIGIPERMPIFPQAVHAVVLLPDWRYRAYLLPYVMTKGRLFF